MNKQNIGLISVLIFTLALAGCTVRTYSVTRDRVDQNLGTGNRGYLQGKMPLEPQNERNTTRKTHVLEIELGPAAKSKAKAKHTPSAMPLTVIEETTLPLDTNISTQTTSQDTLNFEKYTVQRNDTLQKISSKFYGTTRNWKKIYNANTQVLRAPNKIYAGQVLNIPILRIPEEKQDVNLK